MTGATSARGEVWDADLGSPVGNEQAGRRPAIVVSADVFNQGPAGLVVVLPLTSVDRRVPLHVALEPPEGGLTRPGWVKPEDVRAISTARLTRRRGIVAEQTLEAVEARLRALLDL